MHGFGFKRIDSLSDLLSQHRPADFAQETIRGRPEIDQGSFTADYTDSADRLSSQSITSPGLYPFYQCHLWSKRLGGFVLHRIERWSHQPQPLNRKIEKVGKDAAFFFPLSPAFLFPKLLLCTGDNPRTTRDRPSRFTTDHTDHADDKSLRLDRPVSVLSVQSVVKMVWNVRQSDSLTRKIEDAGKVRLPWFDGHELGSRKRAYQ